MEAAAIIMDAVARNAAQPEDQEQSRFDRALQSLESNESVTFMLRQAISVGAGAAAAGAINEEQRLTIPQAQALSEALQRSTSVTTFVSNLKYCTLPAIPFFVDYIRTSPILKEVWAGYSPLPSDSPEMQHGYQAQLDLLFQAVLENPNIKTMNALSWGNPNSIYNLLASSKTLTEFRSAGNSVTAEMALSVAAGLCRSSITNLVLGVEHGPLDIVVSGIGASSVQSFTVWHGHVDAVFCQAISKMLLCTPSLTEVNIADATRSDTQGSLGKIFFDLRHDACAGLKKLHLEDTCLANSTTTTNGEEMDNDAVDSTTVPTMERANKTLERLSLRSARFQTAGDIRLLWNIIGLQELCVGSPSIIHVVESEHGDEQDEGNGNEEEEEDNGNNEALALENWTTFIRRNDKLGKIDLILGVNGQTFVQGILQGARNHPSLSTITILGESPVVVLGGDIGQGLCQVLQETPSALKVLSVRVARLEPACITLLAQGLTVNRSLQILCVSHGNEEILQSLLVNHTVQELTLESLNIEETRRDAFCQALSQVFQSNKTLTKLAISGVDLRAGALTESLQGLPGNKTLKVLSLDGCFIDTDGMTALGQTLESTEIAVRELWLPLSNVPVLMRVFLQTIARMPTIRKICFGGTLQFPTQEERLLLLRAARENKKLLVLDGCATATGDASAESDMANIKYYLKLNQFGRRILDSTNIITSLWPIILAPMTTRPEYAGPLFYFVREYFSRQRQEVNEPQLQQQPQKRARVV